MAKRIVRGKKQRKKLVLVIFGFLAFFVLFTGLIWLGERIDGLKKLRAAPISWVDNDRNVFRTSSWFSQHVYKDCQRTSGGFWPTDQVDCLFTEPAAAPSAADQVAAKDPPGLYYKHLLPTDFYVVIPGLLDSIYLNSLTLPAIADSLTKAVKANPTAYATISIDSVYLGLEGGNGGTMVRTISLMVHPDLERPIANAIGVLQRASNLYKPFIEGATGATISDADLTTLYAAALNRCGSSAVNNDQSGRGVFKIVGKYVVIVQGPDPQAHDLTITNDCNLHVVQLSSGVPSAVCGGSSFCVPSSGPSAPISPISVLSVAPSIVIPTFTLTPTNVISISPGNPGGGNVGNKGFIQQILELLSRLLSFLLNILKHIPFFS